MIRDEDFIKNINVPGPTKEEIRCIVMCKSEVSCDDIVVDIGCGTGGLTVEFAKRAKMVYAIDQNSLAIETTVENIKRHGVAGNVVVKEGDGLYLLKKLENFDILMIGGSGGKLQHILEKGYKKLNVGGRILVTSILLETCLEAVKTIEMLGMTPDVVNVSISKGKLTERGTMMLANNPVTIVSAHKS
ncbi:precorrin-6Y C5,15-methyltransferase (decarboxylating) subunit CbiT [Methanobacterium sp. SMA-27]|uniref:precorrin-6Y C5,15-methyltransferase (decarboxylating) subunit CbiT n=1 Tax=Methanobacterium sp. SMA-27 TaxID=1495336 RepID=UPI00064F78D6|nr:precorrin-6Y C5,15-methyltransferase (decarboxylating) subunit CbiT [Methanobacterium sp. SMA-27]